MFIVFLPPFLIQERCPGMFSFHEPWFPERGGGSAEVWYMLGTLIGERELSTDSSTTVHQRAHWTIS